MVKRLVKRNSGISAGGGFRSDGHTIQETLRKISARIRINKILHHFLIWAAASASVFLVFRLLLLLPIRGTVAWAGLFLGLAGALVWFLAAALRRVGSEEAAGEIDSLGGFCDEFKTARWIVEEKRDHPFERLQVKHAAKRALLLDVPRLIPIHQPRRTLAAVILILAVALAVPTPSLDERQAAVSSPDQEEISQDPSEYREQVQASLKEAGLEPEDPIMKRIDEILNSLEAGLLTIPEAMQQIAETRNAISEEDLDIATTLEDLQDVASAGEQSGAAEGLRKALEEGRIREASEQLKELAANSPAAGPQASQDLEELGERLDRTLEDAKGEDSQPPGETAESQSKSKDSLDPGSLERAIEGLDSLAERMLDQERRNRIDQQLEQLSDALARRDTSEAGPSSESDGQLNKGDAAGAGDEPAGEGAPFGELGTPSSGQAQPSSEGGSGVSAQPGSGLPLQGQATSLEVQLQVEVAASEHARDRQEEDPAIPPSERRSGRQRSSMEYRSTIEAMPYRYENSQDLPPLPWRYRGLAQGYFRFLHDSSTSKSNQP